MGTLRQVQERLSDIVSWSEILEEKQAIYERAYGGGWGESVKEADYEHAVRAYNETIDAFYRWVNTLPEGYRKVILSCDQNVETLRRTIGALIAEDDKMKGVVEKDDIIGERLPDGVYGGTYKGHYAKIVVSDSDNSYRIDIYWGGLFKPDGIGHNHVASVGQKLVYRREYGNVIVD